MDDINIKVYKEAIKQRRTYEEPLIAVQVPPPNNQRRRNAILMTDQIRVEFLNEMIENDFEDFGL